MELFMLIVYISLAILCSRVNASGCYYSANDFILDSPSWVSPCSQVTANAPITNCCAVNSNNICLSSHLCYNPNTPTTFYLSPCTDPQYQSSICPQYCQSRQDVNQLNVVYSANEQLWHCCASDDCTQVTDETFEAPAPADLTILWPPSASTVTEFLGSTAMPTSSNKGAQTSSISTASSSPLNLPGTSSTRSASSSVTSVSSTQTPDSGDGGLSTESRDNIIISLAVGVPGTIATMLGSWFAWKTYRNKKQK